MAWRIDEHVLGIELDNRIRGRVTGLVRLAGRDEPVRLDLEGNPWPDLAGRLVRITCTPEPRKNPAPTPNLAPLQVGAVGDITASRKVRVPDAPMEEFLAAYKTGRVFTFHMANSLYLEWFSERNGRVVVETASFELELVGEPAWTMTREDELAQQEANARAMDRFMEQAAEAVARSQAEAIDLHEDEDEPTSEVEAEADADHARMNQLLDRVIARLEREGRDETGELFDRIYAEQREKLRRERGEPDPPPLTPEQEAEHAAWIEEMNRVAEEALKEPLPEPPPPHPLVEHCRELAIRIHHELRDRNWLPEAAGEEHPLREIQFGLQSAGAKLAGALNRRTEEGEWPPEPLFAGDVLVRLKRARRYLRDVLLALDTAEEQRLATPEWRADIRTHADAILANIQHLIGEVRDALE